MVIVIVLRVLKLFQSIKNLSKKENNEMATVKKEIELPKEASELADAIAGVFKAVKAASADGWQTGTDLPAVAVAAMALLPAAIAGLDQLGAEFKADKGKIILALAVSLDEVL